MNEVSLPEVSVISEFHRPPDLPFTCSDEDLIAAVSLWLCGGREKEVAELLKTKTFTVREWVNSRGWKFIEDCVREDVRKIAQSQVTRLVHRCFNLIDERLEKGDPIYGMNGEILGHRAVRVRDLGMLANTLYERMNEIDGRAKPKDDDNLTLKDLAQSLKNYVQVKREQAKSIPGVVVQQ